MIRLSEKAKIILAVLAVLTVAVGAVAVVAMTSSASDAQTSLDSSQGIAREAGEASGYLYAVVGFDEIKWGSTITEATIIGHSGDTVDSYFIRNSQAGSVSIVVWKINADDSNVSEIFRNENFGLNDSICLTGVGLYRADVTVINKDNTSIEQKFYAQIDSDKILLKPETILPSSGGVFSGSAIEITVQADSAIGFDSTIAQITNVKYVDFYDKVTSSDGINVDEYTGKISVINAGKYTVTLEIAEDEKETYEFEGGNDTIELKFEIKQEVVSCSINISSDEYTTDLSIEELKSRLSFVINDGSQKDKYTVDFGIFTDSSYTTQVNDGDLKIGGTYYAKAVGVNSYKGSKDYLNYRLPEKGESGFDGICRTITLAGPKLTRPAIYEGFYLQYSDINFNTDRTRISFDSTNGTISAFYLGFDYKISQWFYNDNGVDKWSAPLSEEGHENGLYWRVTVNGTEVDPNEYAMRDAGTYNVVISPAEGYQFQGGAKSYKYAFTIKPYNLDSNNIEWTNKKHVYTGSPIAVTEDDYNVINLFGQDKLLFNFELDEVIDGGVPVNAGRYGYHIDSIIPNEYSKNYSAKMVSGDNVSVFDPFVIYKKELPNLQSDSALIAGKKFNGTVQAVGLYDYLNPLGLCERAEKNGETSYIPHIEKVENSVKRTYPTDWNLGSSVYLDDASITADQENEYFRFTHAGNYSVTFVMQTGFRNNHCWYGESDDPDSPNNTHFEWTNFAQIERAEIDPLFAPTQILTNDTEDYNIAKLVADKFGELASNGSPVYSLQFGQAGQSSLSDAPLHGTAGNYIEGNYYVLIDIETSFYPDAYFKPAQNGEYTVNGRQARVDYAVNSSTVSITCNVKESYVFGDNLDPEFKAVTVTTNQAEGVAYNQTVIKYYDGEELLTDGDLLNGSPRNAGSYAVEITVYYTLTSESGTEDLTWNSRRYEITVSQRQLTVTWLVDSKAPLEFTYDGTSHAVSVTVGNVVTGAEDVSVALNNNIITNADTYEFSVDDSCLQGSDKANYTLSGITNATLSVTINKATVTVTANPVADITYGKGGLDSSKLSFTVNPPSYEGKDSLTVAVYNSDGVKITDYVNLDRGAYTVVPVFGEAPDVMPELIDNKYENAQGNYVLQISVTKFSVTSQAITVAFKSGVKRVYGDEIDLWSAIQSVTSGEDTLTIDELKQIASLTATKGSGSSKVVITASKNGVTVSGGKAGKGSYKLGVASNSDDYNVSAVSGSVNYVIDARPITFKMQDVDNHSYGGSYRQQDYKQYEVVGSVIEGDSLSLVGKVVDMSSEQAREMNATLYKEVVGDYYQILAVGGLGTVRWDEEQGYYCYEKDVDNYRVTSIAGRFKIVPRLLTLSFTGGSAVYGDSINLWAQNAYSETDYKRYSTFKYVTASNLRFDGAYALDPNYTDDLKDVIKFSLYFDGEIFNPASDKINAKTYSFKAEIINGNYAIKDGDNSVTELVGETFAVSKKAITVKTTSGVSSNVYGDSFDLSALDFEVLTADGLVNGDAKSDVGVSVALFKGSENVTESISSQNVGSYVVDIAGESANYAITVQSRASLTITKRSASITADSVTNHVYGEALSEQLSFTAETANGSRGFVSDSHWQALNVKASLAGDASKLNVKADGYPITLAITVNDEQVTSNYDVSLVDGKFTIVARAITISAVDVLNHVYGSGWKDGDKANELKYEITSPLGIVNGDELNVTLALTDGSNDVTDRVASLSKGDYVIRVTASNPNYDITSINAVLKIVVLKAKITFKSNVTSIYGEPLSLSELKANVRDNVLFAIEGLLDGDESKVVISIVKKNDSNVSAFDAKAPVGDYVVSVSLDENYEVEYVNWAGEQGKGEYGIVQRKVALTVGDVTNFVYGSDFDVSSLNYTASTSNGQGDAILVGDSLGVVLKIYDGATVVENNAVSSLDVGDYDIKLTYSANGNYNVTSVTNGKLSVSKRVITVSFNSDGTSVYGQTVDLYKSVASVDNVLSKHQWKDVVSLSAVNGKGEQAGQYSSVGNYTVTVSVASAYANNYAIAGNTGTGVYVISKAEITITVPVESSKSVTYDGQAHSFSAVSGVQADGATAVDVAYLLVAKGTVVDASSSKWADATASVPSVTNAGNYTVYVRLSADNHNDKYAQGDITVDKAVITITAKDVTVVYGSELTVASPFYTVSATLSDEVASGYLAGVTYNSDYDKAVTPALTAGLKITPVCGTGDNNVTVNCVAGNITVNKASITGISVASGYNGVYTGSARELFGEMSAVTVNNQSVKWYYREVGSSNDDWTLYNNDTLTDACSKRYEVKAMADNHVDAVYPADVEFAITKNSLNITIDNKSIIYGDALNTVTFSAVCAEHNGILESLVNSYINSVLIACSVNGYSATINAGSELEIASAYEGDGNVAVTVNKGTLTVSKRTVNVSFNSLNSVYGDALANDVLSSLYNVANLIGDSLDVSAKNGEHNLTDDKAPAGTYVVTVKASDNYLIDYANGVEQGEYVINKRHITVSTDKNSAVYVEDEVDGVVDYHNGQYGKTQYVNAVFDNIKDEFVLGEHYAVTYKLNNVDATPNKAGEYKVIVTVTDGNYVLDGTDEFNYEITRKQLASSSFMWEDSTLTVTSDNEGKFDNGVKDYVADIMEILSFTVNAGNSATEDILEGEETQANSYYYKNGQLRVNIQIVYTQVAHFYTLQFKLNEQAVNNYALSGSEVQEGVVKRIFSVSSKVVTAILVQKNWQYSDAIVLPSTKTVIDGKEYFPVGESTVRYAPVTNAEQAKSMIGGNGYDFDDVKDLYNDGDLSTTFNNFDVGYYVICVTYTGQVKSADGNAEYIAVRRFNVFEVTKKKLSVPSFESVKYNGQEQSLIVKYDDDVNGVKLNSIITAYYNSKIIESGSAIKGKNADDYTVRFSINQGLFKKYAWDLDSLDSDKLVTWTIGKDDNANDGAYFTVSDINPVYGDEITLNNPEILKDGYNYSGVKFVWKFATWNVGNEDKPSAIGTWYDDIPQNYGKYWMKVVLTDTNANPNFTDKTYYAILDISKKEIYATASGSLVYGDGLDKGTLSYEIEGLVGDDKATAGEVVYKLAEDYAKLLAGGDYKVILTTNDDGTVAGLNAGSNYVIKAKAGKLTVNKRPVTVEINNATSQYKLPISELTIKSISDSYAQGDAEFTNGITLSTEATATSVVAEYAITGDNSNSNYNVTFVNATYTVTFRDVTVTLANGSGTYKGTIDYVTYSATVLDADGQSVALESSEGFKIVILYNGQSAEPTNAGSYDVTILTADDSNANYALANAPTLNFVIDKFTVDVSKISVQTKVYTGGKHIAEIKLDGDADFGADVFAISGQKEFVAVGDHDIVLQLNDFANYRWSNSDNERATVIFVIDKAGIYATPCGSITYGDSFAKNTVKWLFVFAENGNEVPSNVIDEISINIDSVEFTFREAIALDRPLANTYGITCGVDESGRIVGLSHESYNITLKPNDSQKYGDYVVNKKALTIVAGNSKSVYSQNPQDYLSNAYRLDTTAENNALVNGDVLTDVIKNYTPSTVATSLSDVNSYAVTATAQADNYQITVKAGVHVIEPIKVTIELVATDGQYHGANVTYGVKKLQAVNLENYDFVSAGFSGRLIYSFAGTEGTSYEGNEAPQDAGKYQVTARLSDAEINYVIEQIKSTSFVIAKKVIDENAITIESKRYNGYAQEHGLTDGDGYTVANVTFKNAGTHDVTLTLSNSANYAWSVTQGDEITKTFEITKASLTLTPYGTITYGDSFDTVAEQFRYELTGLLGEDEGKQNGEIVTGSVKYLLANGVDGSKLAVKDDGYAMTADVSGLISQNYIITVGEGSLTVNRRNITIRPVHSQSVYGQKVTVSQDFTLENGTSLAEWDTKADIDYLADCTANSESDADDYDVTVVRALNSNYNITLLKGTHTVNKATVGVRIRPINGIYGDENNVARIEFVSVEVIYGDGQTVAVDNLQFEVHYAGRAYDLSYYDDNKIPEKAGVYTATVRRVLSDNYELNANYGISSAMLEVCKRVISADNIKAVSAQYTGSNIIPEIDDKFYNVNGQKVYNTIYAGSLKDVGTYDITLSLVDTNNCEWLDNLNRTTTIKFEILKADNKLVDPNNPNAPVDEVKVVISDWTFDSEGVKPQATVASGDTRIVYEYSKSENGDYTTEVPKDAGVYWVRATVSASDNYNAYVSKATKFEINKKSVALPTVTNLEANTVYTGSMLSLDIDGFDDKIMSLTLGNGMYRADVDGSLNLLALNADTYTATFKLRNLNNYEWSDSDKLVDGAVVITWTIERQVVKRLSDASSKILVNGEDIVFMPEGFNSGIMTIEGNVHAHEGSYNAIVTLKDTKNYVWEDTDSPAISVKFELTGTNVAFVASICVVAGLCVGLAVMAVILTLVNRRKKRKEAEAIDARSRADGWEGE